MQFDQQVEAQPNSWTDCETLVLPHMLHARFQLRTPRGVAVGGAVFRFDAKRRRERNRNAASDKNNQAVKSGNKTEESSSRNGSHTARFDYATARKSRQSDGEAARRSFPLAGRTFTEPSIVDVPSAIHPVSQATPRTLSQD